MAHFERKIPEEHRTEAPRPRLYDEPTHTSNVQDISDYRRPADNGDITEDEHFSVQYKRVGS